MANSEAGTSSDVAAAAGGEYQVFLSFRGPDTRHAFTDFLYKDLVEVGLRVFRDDDELRAGDVIGESLLCAINSSTIYIPVFSGTYAVSKWCLRELAHIVDHVSKSEGQKRVLPIFFHVEPEDVKLKTPLYSNALLEHAEKFPNEVEAWRAALEQVGKIKGWNVRKDQSQATIVKLVVKEILEKLKIKQKSVGEHLIGLDDRVKDLMSFLDVKYDDVRLVGIYGMGGIGKTTIAKVIFNQLCPHFGKCCSFLEDVRENSTKDGIVQLQMKLLSDIVGLGSIEKIRDDDEGMRRIGDIISNKKVLVVLDDVNEKLHIKKLIGNFKLHSGSRVIITTRDKAVLKVDGFQGETKSYEMQKMEKGPALQLFCWHAFGGDSPSHDYIGLSNEIVSSAGGLPLAITVVGSLLKEKEKGFWEETLSRLNEAPENEILEKLRISYDTLDEGQREIFLDIACFFFNKEMTNAIYMWDDCKFYPKRGIDVLTKRCLIKILDNDKFWMHDLLIALGRQIVHKDGRAGFRGQTRLWIPKETDEIIKTQERKHKVQALHGTTLGISNKDLENLPELRYLDLRGGTFAGDFGRCTSNLRWLSWSHFMDYLKVDNLHLDRLVVCKLSNINFKDDSKAWDFIKCAGNLKALSIESCSSMTTIRDISQCSRLERLTLKWCSRLKRIESFIGNLRSLVELKIEKCYNLAYLPQEIGALVKLEHFSLWGSHDLRELPGSIENLTSLAELNLSDTSIGELPKSIGKLKSLRKLHFKRVLNPSKENPVWQLPSDINMLVNLEELDIQGYLGMNGKIPIGIGELSSLRFLSLSGTGICKIPSTIKMLHCLQRLRLSNCDAIQELPELPPSLTSLYLLNSLRSVPNLGNLTNLVNLGLGNGFPYAGKSSPITGGNLSWIWQLPRLKRLHLGLEVPPRPELASLSHLEVLSLDGLDREALKQLPRNLSTLWLYNCDIPLPRNLSTLRLYNCEVEDIPSDGLQQLEDLSIYSCDRIQRLSIPSELSKLRCVIVIGCAKLAETRVVGLLESLEFFSIWECKSLTRISGLSHSKNLETLIVSRCRAVTDVEGLDELESLKRLVVWRCPSLRRLIDASCTKIPHDCEVYICDCGDSVTDSKLWEPLKDYRKKILENPTKKRDDSDENNEDDEDGDSIFEDDEDGDSEDGEDNYEDDEDGDSVDNTDSYEDDDDDDMQEVDIEREEDCREEMMKMSREQLTTKTDVHSEEDGGESKIVGSGNRRQMRVGGTRTGCASKPGRDPADRGRARSMTSSSRDGKGSRSHKDAVFTSGKSTASNSRRAIASSSRSSMTSSSGRGRVSTPGMGTTLSSGRGTTKMGASLKSGTDEGSSSAKVKAGTGNRRQMRVGGTGTARASKLGRDPADRGGARSMTSSSRDGKGSRSGKDAAFTSGKSTASNSVRAIASISRSSMTSSSGRGRVSTTGTGTTSSPGRGTTKMGASFRSGTDEGSSSAKVKAGTGNRRQMRVGGTGTGCASKPGRDSADRGRARSMSSSSRDGKGSRSGKEAAFTSGKGTASNSGRAIASSSRSSMTSSSGRGRVSTPGTGTTLSSGRGTIKMGPSLRSGTDEGSSSAQAEPQTSGYDKNNKANTSRQGSKQKI